MNSNPLADFLRATQPSQVGACSTSGRDPLQGGTNGDTSMAALQRRALLREMPQKLLGLNAATNPVLAATAFVATGTSPVPVRPTRIEFPPSTAPFFTISAVTVGLCTMILGGNPGAELFAPNSMGPYVEFKEVGPGSPITMTGNNIDVAAHRVDAGVWAIDKSCEWGPLCESC